MRDALASFRELNGVGPATEGRLHGSGLYTWTALSEVVSALADVRGVDTLRELSDVVAGKAAAEVSDGGNPGVPDAERSEAFILRMVLDPDGRALRSSVTHVRSQDEQASAGWSPGEVIQFVEQRAGVVGPASAAAVTEANGPGPSRDHLLVLDAGKALGRGRRTIALHVSTDRVGCADIEYRATLVGRPYGHVGDTERVLAGQAGRVHPPSGLPLHFEAVELPPGVQRLRLRLAVRLPAPQREAPVLELR